MEGGVGASADLLGELLHLAHVDEAADSKNDTRGPVLDDGGLLDFAHLRGHQVSRDRSLPAGPLRGLRAASRPPEPVPSPKRSSQTRVPGPEAGTARSTAPREGGRGLEAACGRAGAAPIDKHRSRSPSRGLFDPRAPAFFRARLPYRNSRRGPGPVSNLSCHVQMREGTEGVLKLLILSLFIHYSRIQCARLCIAAPAGSALTKLPGCRAPYPPPPPFSSSSPARSCHCTTLPSHPTVASIGR